MARISGASGGKYFKWTGGAIWFAAIMLAMLLLCTAIDPYLTVFSPLLAQMINAALPMLLVILLWGLIGRPFLAMFAGLFVLTVAVIVDHLKWRFLHSDLVFADLRIVPMLLLEPRLVLGFVQVSIWKWLAGVVVLAAIVAVLSRLPWGRFVGWRIRLTLVLLAMIGFGVLLGGRSPAMIPSIGWEVFSQPIGASHVGVLGNVLLGLRTRVDVKPSVDIGKVDAFRNAPEVQAQDAAAQHVADSQRPDIVVVQSESLFEPSELCGMAATPVLQNIANGGSGPAGKLVVPVFGGRTLQTEFEVQTGASVDFFRGSQFAYYDLVDHPIDALPRQLEGLGYRTLAMHPGLRGFWRRGYVLPRLGFGAFIDGDAFVSSDTSSRGHVRDDVLMQAVVSELDASSKPGYILAITMDNHGPWGTAAPDPAVESFIPAGLHGAARTQFADYLSRAVDADRSWKLLTDALAARKRPTIAIIYGDHLPGLASVYDRLCFKDGAPATSNWPPLQVWANFPIPPLPPKISSYLLGGWLTRAAGLEGDRVMQDHADAAAIAADAALPAARKKLLEDDYVEVAAQNIYAQPKAMDGPVLSHVDARDSLRFAVRHVAGEAGAVPLRQSNEGFALLESGRQESTIDLALNAQVAFITARLFNPLTQAGGPAKGVVHVVISGDGRTLLDAVVTPASVNLATLDVSGVVRLRIHSHAVEPYAGVQPVLKIAQMQCYDETCTSGRLPPGTGRLATLDVSREIGAPDDAVMYVMEHEKGRRNGVVPIKVDWQDQLFIHSGNGYTAWLEIDAENLKSMTLKPRLRPMDETCKAIPGAGTVDFIVSADGKPLQRVHVMPGYHETLTLALHGAKRVRFSVDSDGDSSCDWFYVKFPLLQLNQPWSRPWWEFFD